MQSWCQPLPTPHRLLRVEQPSCHTASRAAARHQTRAGRRRVGSGWCRRAAAPAGSSPGSRPCPRPGRRGRSARRAPPASQSTRSPAPGPPPPGRGTSEESLLVELNPTHACCTACTPCMAHTGAAAQRWLLARPAQGDSAAPARARARARGGAGAAPCGRARAARRRRAPTRSRRACWRCSAPRRGTGPRAPLRGAPPRVMRRIRRAVARASTRNAHSRRFQPPACMHAVWAQGRSGCP